MLNVSILVNSETTRLELEGFCFRLFLNCEGWLGARSGGEVGLAMPLRGSDVLRSASADAGLQHVLVELVLV